MFSFWRANFCLHVFRQVLQRTTSFCSQSCSFDVRGILDCILNCFVIASDRWRLHSFTPIGCILSTVIQSHSSNNFSGILMYELAVLSMHTCELLGMSNCTINLKTPQMFHIVLSSNNHPYTVTPTLHTVYQLLTLHNSCWATLDCTSEVLHCSSVVLAW